jgi:transposase
LIALHSRTVALVRLNTRAWLARHPRWTFHFIPTPSSWLNAVEGFFAKLTRRRLKHDLFKSVDELKGAIDRFIAEHYETDAKPFVWRADPDEIIAARNRGFQMLESIHLYGGVRLDRALPYPLRCVQVA